MALRFSQRIGKSPVAKPVQMEGMDTELKNGLWNVLKLTILDPFAEEEDRHGTGSLTDFAVALWKNFLKRRIEGVQGFSTYQIQDRIREWYNGATWIEVYDMIDFVASMSMPDNCREDYISQTNSVLEREFAAWRFIEGVLAPVFNTTEISVVEEAIAQSEAFSAMHGANAHFTNALRLLSDRSKPDYTNSIKESIQAVESTVRVITGEGTLGKGLSTLEARGLLIDAQLKAAFERMYAWTNNKTSGIRHAIILGPVVPDFEEAKYMLVACSAFVNYLVGKAVKQGISLN